MILTCPECSTRYKTKSETIGINGRTVRCQQCSTTWFVAAPTEKERPEALLTPDELQLADMKAEDVIQKAQAPREPANPPQNDEGVSAPIPGFHAEHKSADVIMRDKVDAAKRRRRLRTILLIWLIPLGLIALGVFLLLLGRDQIIDRYPGTAPFYNAVGIKASVTGLEIEKPTIRVTRINGEQTIIINGAVKNISRETQPLPYLRLSLHTAGGDEVALWRVEFNRTNLKSGERIPFASEYANPPIDVKRLKYRLGDQAIGAEAPINSRPDDEILPESEPLQ